MTSQSGGGGGSAPFSGLSARNNNIGMTIPDGTAQAPDFTASNYDTDGYLTSPTVITFPRTGYYRVILGFVSDSVFVGKWELRIVMGSQTLVYAQGPTITGELAEGQVSDEGKCNAGDTATMTISQTSGADQLVYPYVRVSYLGS